MGVAIKEDGETVGFFSPKKVMIMFKDYRIDAAVYFVKILIPGFAGSLSSVHTTAYYAA